MTAPSSGVAGEALTRLDAAISALRDRGYRVLEGSCLRSQIKNASAPARVRAEEFERLLWNDEVSAVFPPWGGELASEILELIDFQALAQCPPKWILGYSDVSTLQLPLTLVAGWATAHGPNLMELTPAQTDPLTANTLSILEADMDRPFRQDSSVQYQAVWSDFVSRPDRAFGLDATTQWKRLDGSGEALQFKGRLIGGCLDTLAWLAGSQYGDVRGYIESFQADGVILYLENVELPPPALIRALLSLKRHGWFGGLSGLMFGRSPISAAATSADLCYVEALQSVLGELACPVLYDVDNGHQPPQMTLINGAMASVTFTGRGGYVVQSSGE